MATFEITRDGAKFRVTVSPERAASITEDELFAMIDGGNSAQPSQAAPREQGIGERFAGALRTGAGDLARGLGATATEFDRQFDSPTARSAAESLAGVLPEDPNYRRATPEVVEGLRQGDAGRVLSYLPRAAVETVPSLVGSIAAFRAGGLPGVVAFNTATTAGNVAQSRAQNDGRTETTPEDRAIGLGTGAAIGVIDRFGLPGQGAATRGFTGRLGGVARTSGREAGTESLQDVGQQAAETTGTARGFDVDLAQTGAAGLTGATASAGLRTPGAVVRGTTESIAQAGAERAFGDMTPEVAESVVRLNGLLEQTAALYRERTGQEAPPDELFNAARGELETQLRRLTHRAETQGWLDQDSREGSLVRELITTAVRHNRALVDGAPDVTGYSLGQGLGQLDTLVDTPAIFRNGMRTLLTDLDQLSRAARKNRMTGPFEQAGRAAGALTSVGLGAATGGPLGALAGAAANIGGNPLPARVGGGIGRLVDRIAGTRAPAITLVRDKAERILRRSGRDPGATLQTLTELDRVLTDERLAARAAMGLPTDPDTMAAEAARAAEKRAQREAERETERRRKAEEAEMARQMAWTEGNPELEARVRRARLNAQARVRLETARDLAAEDAAAIRRQKADEQRRAAAEEERAAKVEVQRLREEAQRSAAQASEDARQMAWTEGNPELEAAIRRARDAAQARVAAEVARDLGNEAAARVRGEKAAQRAAEKAAARDRANAEAAEKARQKAEQDRQDAEIAAQIAASESIAYRAALAKARAQRRVEQQMMRDLERDAEAAVQARQEEPAAEPVATAKRRTRRKAATEAAQPPESPPATPVAPAVPEAASGAPASAPAPEIVDVPNDRPDANARGPMFGWQRYVQVSIRNKGRNVTRDEMAQAVDRLRERGDLMDDEADALLQGAVDKAPRRLLASLIADIATTQGWSFEDTPDVGQGLPPGTPGTPPGFYAGVNRPASWQGAADFIQGHLETYRAAALAGDRDLGLAQVLGTLGLPNGQVNADTKRAIAEAALKSAPENQRAFRAAALAPWIKPEAQEGAPPTSATPTQAETVIATAEKRKRGRPPGTGKNQRAAAAEAAAVPASDGTVEMGSAGERVPASDAVLSRFRDFVVRKTPELARKSMEPGDAGEQAARTLERLEAKLAEIVRANAVWRARTTKEDTPSE